jgi:hypothetical protein
MAKLDPKKAKEFAQAIDDINLSASETASTFKSISTALSGLARDSKDFGESIKNAKDANESLVNSANKLASFTKEDLKDRKKMNAFQKAASDLASKRVKLESKIKELNVAKLNATKKEKAILDKTLENLQASASFAGELEGQFEDILNVNEDLNKSTKWLDAIEESLRSLPGIGPLIAGPFKKAGETVRAAKADGDGFFKRMGKGAIELGKAFGPAFILKSVFAIDSRLVNMQRTLQLSEVEAENLNTHFNDIALSSGEALYNQDQLLKSYKELAQLTGVTSGFTDDQLKNQAKLTERIGVSAESAAELAKYQSLTGKDAKTTNLEIADQVANLKKETGISLKLSDVMDEVAKTNAGLQAAYGFNNKLLAKAVITAKKFGIELAQAEKIASGMLDFESSIANELEAELLTGKELNLEQARLLALQGKSADAAAEVLKQVGSTEDLTKMNVIQQEALAKAVGMERNELIKSVKEKEILQKLGKNTIADAAKTAEGRKKLIELGGEDLLQAYDRESQAEKFEAVVIKIQKAREKVANALSPIVGFFADLLSSSAGLYTTLTLIGTVALASMLSKGYEIVKNIGEMLGIERAIKTEKTLQNVEETALNVEKGIGIGLSTEEKVLETGNVALKKAGNTQEKIGLGLALRNVAISGFELIKSIGIAVMSAISSLSKIPFIGPFLGLAVGATIGALGMKYMSDGVIGPGGEMVVSGPKGSIQLDKDDSIVAGTNLMGGNKGGGNGGGKSDNSALIAKVEQLIGINQQILAKSPVIEMGGNEVGQGINTAEREIQ